MSVVKYRTQNKNREVRRQNKSPFLVTNKVFKMIITASLHEYLMAAVKALK